MGIPGLLKILEESRIDCFLEELVGKRVAIDASDWIYRAFSVPYGAFDAKQYLFGRLIYLLHFNIKPILVFDGQQLPAKKEVHEERTTQRAKMLMEADKLVAKGNMKKAVEMRRKAGAGTGKLKEAIKELCTAYKIPFVQSPFEADAQIAHLVKKNLVDFVISNDSDMMVYGCPKVLYKLKNGKGKLYDQDHIEQSWGVPYDEDTFRAVSILTGSDYLKGGLPGFGIKSAREMYSNLVQPFNYEQMMDLVAVREPPDFKKRFDEGVNVFKYQLIFDVVSKKIEPLTPYPEGKTALDYPGAGDPLIAEGNYYDVGGEQVSLPVWLRSQRSTPRLYFCSVCLKVFSSYQNRHVHMLRSHPELKKRWMCDQCGKLFGKRNELRTHSSCIHGLERPFVCNVCKKGFVLRSRLSTHQTIHNFLQPFECEFCQDRFKLNGHLTRHIQRHTGEKPYFCSKQTCKMAFARSETRDRHMRTHKDEKPFTCETCGKSFSLKQSLTRHLKTHTGELSFICETCGKRFARSDFLKAHIRIHTGEKPYTCETCGRAFAKKSSLTDHIRTHTGEKTFVCSDCGRRFTRGALLTRHLRIHTGEKPFGCDLCGQKFARKDTLRSHHTRIHKSLPTEPDQVLSTSQESLGIRRSGKALGGDGSGKMTGEKMN